MRTRNKIVSKLKSRSGESIGEVLIALLVAAVGLVLLAGMIASTTNLVERSRNKMGDYVAADKVVVEKSGDSGNEGTVVIRSGAQSVKLSDDRASASIPVVYYTNSSIPGQDVTSYKVK